MVVNDSWHPNLSVLWEEMGWYGHRDNVCSPSCLPYINSHCGSSSSKAVLVWSTNQNKEPHGVWGAAMPPAQAGGLGCCMRERLQYCHKGTRVGEKDHGLIWFRLVPLGNCILNCKYTQSL